MTEPAVKTPVATRAPARMERADSEIGAPPIIKAASPKRYWLWLIPLALLLVAIAVLFQFNPSKTSFYPLCVFHRMTGLQCPGCGGLRATHHLLHGDVLTAFRFNPLVVLALPLGAWFAWRRWRRGANAPNFSHRAVAVWAWVLFAVIVLFWIARNLPLEIFKLPAEV